MEVVLLSPMVVRLLGLLLGLLETMQHLRQQLVLAAAQPYTAKLLWSARNMACHLWDLGWVGFAPSHACIRA